jgi:hypothetical protein
MLRPPRALAPTDEELAAAFYREAVRDLQDARILHTHQRWSGCMTASMHATEKRSRPCCFSTEPGTGWT